MTEVSRDFPVVGHEHEQEQTYVGHFQIGAHFLSGGLICDATCHIFEKSTQHKFKGDVSRSFWIPNAKFV